jgi:hypothetical protein
MRIEPFRRRSQLSAPTSTLALHRPDEINWIRIALQLTLGLILLGNLLAPLTATAQNLGTSPVFGKAVQGQQATTVEGTVMNVVNWSCNVIAPVSVAWRKASSLKRRAFSSKGRKRCRRHSSSSTFSSCCST